MPFEISHAIVFSSIRLAILSSHFKEALLQNTELDLKEAIQWLEGKD